MRIVEAERERATWVPTAAAEAETEWAIAAYPAADPVVPVRLAAGLEASAETAREPAVHAVRQAWEAAAAVAAGGVGAVAGGGRQS